MADPCVIQTFGWCEQTWLLLDQLGILGADIMLSITVIAALVAWFSKERIRRWFTRNRFPKIGGQVSADDRWDGIVFTISRQQVPKWVMQTLLPQVVGFVASEQSKQEAEALATYARQLGIDVAGTLVCPSVDDPAATRACAATLLSAMQSAGHDRLGVDLTGGKVPMSLGAFMAAEEAGVDSLYVSVPFNAGLDKPDMRQAGICRVSKGRD